MSQYTLIKEIIEDLEQLENYGASCEMSERLKELLDLANSFLNDMVPCDDCGRILHNDEAHIYKDDVYCRCCYEEIDETGDIIKTYHDHKDEFEFKDMGESLPKEYRGFELEIEAEDISSEILETLASYKDEFFYEEDGSLTNGFEVISNPMSFDYWRNKGFSQIEGLIEDLQSVAEVNSWDSGTCGLHVHFSRDEWSNGILRILIRLIVRNHDYFKAISGRDDFEYCRMPNYNDYNLGSLTNGDRYIALNFNRNTLEFRFFRGTLNTESIWCSIEICNMLLRYCEYLWDNKKLSTWYLTPSGFEGWLEAKTRNSDRLLQFIRNRIRCEGDEI